MSYLFVSSHVWLEGANERSRPDTAPLRVGASQSQKSPGIVIRVRAGGSVLVSRLSRPVTAPLRVGALSATRKGREPGHAEMSLEYQLIEFATAQNYHV